MKSQISYYLSVLIRRFHYFIIIFGLIAAASITVAQLLPPVYSSRASLLVEAPQIPQQLAASTVVTAAAEQLQIIEQRLLTRANLLDISRRLNVFDNASDMSADQIVRRMRQSTTIWRSTGRNQATFMEISFNAPKPQIAANVTNEYVTIILQDNAEIRAGRAGETMAFFEDEEKRLGLELEALGAEILNYKTEHSDALPETLQYRLTLQSRLLTQHDTLINDKALLEDQKVRLAQIFEATGRLGTATVANQTPEQIKLAQLEDQLAQAMAIYSSENPKVKLLESQIRQLQNSIALQGGQAASDSTTGNAALDLQLADIDGRVALLDRQIEAVNVEIADLDDSIKRTPAVTIALDALNRDFQNVQAQYNSAINRLALATTGERIELLSKGQRITILEAATVPNDPIKPNRKLIAVGGTGVGFALGLAFVIVLEILSSAIRRPSDITNGIGITPITTIPYIRTPYELVARRAMFLLVFLFVALGVPAILYAVHVYYLPLDLIYERFMARFDGLF